MSYRDCCFTYEGYKMVANFCTVPSPPAAECVKLSSIADIVSVIVFDLLPLSLELLLSMAFAQLLFRYKYFRISRLWCFEVVVVRGITCMYHLYNTTVYSNTGFFQFAMWLPEACALARYLLSIEGLAGHRLFGPTTVDVIEDCRDLSAQGEELAWNYRTLLIPLIRPKFDFLPEFSDLSPEDVHRILLVPKSCTFEKDCRLNDIEEIHDMANRPVKCSLESLKFCDFKMDHIKKPLCRIPKKEVYDDQSAQPLQSSDYYYFVYDFPKILESSLIECKLHLSQETVDMYRNQFVEEVKKIVEAEGPIKIEIIEYDSDENLKLSQIIRAKLESLS